MRANSISTFLRSRRNRANASEIARSLVDIGDDSSCTHVWAALWLEWARTALRHGGKIAACMIAADTTGRGQCLTCRARVDVPHFVIAEVLARKRAVPTLRLVNNGDMRRDALLVDEPFEVGG
jgi:hypothetical protein